MRTTTPRSHTQLLACVTFTMLSTSIMPVIHAQDAVEPGESEGPAINPMEDIDTQINFSMTPSIIHQFDADFEDDGGEYDATRLGINLGSSIAFNKQLQLGLNLSYQHDHYSFSGSSGFAALDPWDDINTLRFAANVRYQINEQWGLFGGPIIAYSAENGADFSDSLTGGGIIGATYQVNPTLTLGLGIGAISQLEDSAAIFPIIVLNYQIDDQLSIRSGRGGVGSGGGGGLEIAWQFRDEWNISLGANYATRRFRLNDEDIAPDGIGEENLIPIYATLTYSPRPQTSIALTAGFIASGELTIEDEDGDEITEEDIDPVPFVGLRATFRF